MYIFIIDLLGKVVKHIIKIFTKYVLQVILCANAYLDFFDFQAVSLFCKNKYIIATSPL